MNPCPALVDRPRFGKVALRIPEDPANRDRIRAWCGGRSRPEWDGRTWRVARQHFQAVIEGAARDYGCVNVFAIYATQTPCTTFCQHASPETIWDCECSCEGQQHAGGAIAGHVREVVGPPMLIGTDWMRRHWRVYRAG